MWQRNLPIVFEFLFSDDGEKIFKSVCRWRFFVAIITNHTHHTETTTYLVRVSFDLVILKARLHWTFVVQQSATFVGKSWRSKSSSVDEVKTSPNNVGDCWRLLVKDRACSYFPTVGKCWWREPIRRQIQITWLRVRSCHVTVQNGSFKVVVWRDPRINHRIWEASMPLQHAIKRLETKRGRLI